MSHLLFRSQLKVCTGSTKKLHFKNLLFLSLKKKLIKTRIIVSLFNRCEDICWIRTNIKNPGHSKNLDPKAVFQRTKEHCLMGIKGTVRRSTDGDFIHANVDIDLIISEENEYGSLEKPVEIFHIIEHFCLGK